MTDGRLDRRGALEAEIRARLGFVPAFFRAAASVEVAEQLWSQARTAHLDSPIAGVFREALFAYLSRFCAVPYCMARHAAFLLGRVGPGRHTGGPLLDPEAVLRLLRRPPPTPDEIRSDLKTLADCAEPMEGFPADRESAIGRAVFAASVHLFLGGECQERCSAALRCVLGPEPFDQLLAFLGFVRTAHAWTEGHPELEVEDDVEELLEEQPALRSWIASYRSAVAKELAEASRVALEHAQRELRANENRFRLLVEHTPAAVAMLDREMRYLAVSKRWIEDLRLGNRDVLGRSHYDVFPEMPERWREFHRRGLAGEAIGAAEDSFVRLDGQVDWIRWELHPWHTSSGEIGGILLFGEVITKQKRAEDSLHKSEALAETILDTVPDAVLSIDEAGIITHANAATGRLFGYPPSELMGQNVRMLMPSPYAEEHDRYLERYRRTGEARIIGKGREVEGRRRDGSVFPVRLAVGEGDHDGSRWFTGIIHDLSEVRELQRQLLQSQKMEAIGTLAGGIAHDFNNLLTSIRGSTEILTGHLRPGSRLVRSAERIQRAADRAAALTGRLLAFSRQQLTQRRVVDLNEVIRETQDLLARTLSEDLLLKLDLASVPLYVCADPGQIGQVVLNLEVNASDAMGPGGSLRVATRQRPDGHAAIIVRDTGKGIPSSDLERIFEPFFTSKEVGKGTGLGLATALGIVREHGGTIEVESQVGIGSTFTVVLPEVAAPAERAADEAETVPRTVPSSEKILLVEDDEIARELFAEVLGEEGYSVVSTTDPDEALSLARALEGRIDLLVSDVVLPGMSGIELARELRGLNAQLRVLYMSGYADWALADRGELESDAALLRKPFGNAALLRKVREVLDAGSAS